MSLKDFPHFLTDPEGGLQTQGGQDPRQEELLEPGQAGEKEDFDWETTGGETGVWLGSDRAGGGRLQ